jgi:hypothetical protein
MVDYYLAIIYGVWNGSGWYTGYLKLLTEAYNKGIQILMIY